MPTDRRTGLPAPSHASSQRLVTSVSLAPVCTTDRMQTSSCPARCHSWPYRTGTPIAASSSRRCGSRRCWLRLRSGVGVNASMSSPWRSKGRLPSTSPPRRVTQWTAPASAGSWARVEERVDVDPGLAPDLEGPRVHHVGRRRPLRAVAGLDDLDAQPEAGGEERRGEPDRPRTDHEHVHVGRELGRVDRHDQNAPA